MSVSSVFLSISPLPLLNIGTFALPQSMENRLQRMFVFKDYGQWVWYYIYKLLHSLQGKFTWSLDMNSLKITKCPFTISLPFYLFISATIVWLGHLCIVGGQTQSKSCCSTFCLSSVTTSSSSLQNSPVTFLTFSFRHSPKKIHKPPLILWSTFLTLSLQV